MKLGLFFVLVAVCVKINSLILDLTRLIVEALVDWKIVLFFIVGVDLMILCMLIMKFFLSTIWVKYARDVS